jgi:hypothetical protein
MTREIYPHYGAVKNMLRHWSAQDAAGKRRLDIEALRKEVRAELQRIHPDCSNAQVERLCERRIEAGMRPTADVPPRKPPVPFQSEALIANRLQRKITKQKLRGRR